MSEGLSGRRAPEQREEVGMLEQLLIGFVFFLIAGGPGIIILVVTWFEHR